MEVCSLGGMCKACAIRTSGTLSSATATQESCLQGNKQDEMMPWIGAEMEGQGVEGC